MASAVAVPPMERLSIGIANGRMQIPNHSPQVPPPSTDLFQEEEMEKTSTSEYIFRSKLPDIEISNGMNLANYTFEKVPQNLDRVALVDGVTGQQWTFRETEILCKKVAVGLNKLGVEKGDVIALLLPNCVEFVLVFLGSALRGSIVTTCNPDYTPMEIANQFNAAKTKLIVTQAAYVEKVRDLGAIVLTTDDPPPGFRSISLLFDNDENDVPKTDVHPDNVVCIPFSSGTTGFPKGVMLTHKSLITNVAQQVDGENAHFSLTNEDVVMCMLPMVHIYSLNSILLCSMRVCCTMIVVAKPPISHLLDLLQKHRVTMLPVVPPIVLAIVKSPVTQNYDLSSVRLIMSGAAPLGKELEDSFHAKFPRAIFGQGYGMTEAGPVLCMCLSFAREPFPVKSGSVGTVVRNAELKIVDPATGASLGYNKPGEICIRGSQIMKGYFNNPEATSQAIDRDGWLHTGDVAYVDEDQQVFIVDRLKEIIKVRGFQVAPAELEAILVSHPSIADAAVIPKPDERAGELPVAFVVRSEGSEGVTEEFVKEIVSKQVVYYKKLSSVIFVDSIPKIPSGKILRKDLRKLLASN